MRENLNTAITNPKGIKVESNIISYDSKGESDAISTSKLKRDQAVASKMTVGNDIVYNVKVRSDGHLFNPLKNDFKYGLDKVDSRSSEAMFKFKQVNKSTFDNYIKFLITKNDSLLDIAERNCHAS